MPPAQAAPHQLTSAEWDQLRAEIRTEHEAGDRERRRSVIRLPGTANDADMLLEPAVLEIGPGRRIALVLDPDNDAVRVVGLPTEATIDELTFRSRFRFVPIAGAAILGRASGDWLVLRGIDGLAFRPDDLDAAREAITAAGYVVGRRSELVRRWPGDITAGALGEVAVLLAVLVALGALVTWLLSSAGVDTDAPAPAAAIVVVALVLGAMVLSGPLHRWHLHRVAARGRRS